MHSPAFTTINKLLKEITPLTLVYVFAGVVIAGTVRVLYLPVRRVFSPLRLLPGPKSESLIWGNLRQILGSPNVVIQDEWAEAYGPVFVCRGLFSACRLVPLDTQALNFILSASDAFEKPPNMRQGLENSLGPGLLVVESDDHKRQRRVMNPSFGPSHIRALLPIFWQKAVQLKDILSNIAKSSPEEETEIDVLSWVSRASLDIIGLAGFDYHFNSLDEHDDELLAAFKKGILVGPSMSALGILNRFVPGTRDILPDQRTRRQREASAIMQRIGAKLVESKKASLVDEVKTGLSAQQRDLLTLLIKSNTAADNGGQTMSDDEVLAQISTFLFAGHETISTTMAWALYELARNPEVQRQLRQELLDSRLGDEPIMADLDKLKHLDNVVREVLRLHPAVPTVVREATRNLHIPVSRPFKDRTGTERNFVVVQKGDGVYIPVAAMNRRKEIWGEDSTEFLPQRWDGLSETVKDMPGVWGHLLTFFHGNRACIGYRFAIAELKVLLYTLVRSVEFDIDPCIQVECKGLSARPLVVSHPEKGNQMPLICKPVLAI